MASTFHTRMRAARVRAGLDHGEAGAFAGQRLGYRKVSASMVRRLEGYQPSPISEEKANHAVIAALAQVYGVATTELSELAQARCDQELAFLSASSRCTVPPSQSLPEPPRSERPLSRGSAEDVAA